MEKTSAKDGARQGGALCCRPGESPGASNPLSCPKCGYVSSLKRTPKTVGFWCGRCKETFWGDKGERRGQLPDLKPKQKAKGNAPDVAMEPAAALSGKTGTERPGLPVQRAIVLSHKHFESPEFSVASMALREISRAAIQKTDAEMMVEVKHEEGAPKELFEVNRKAMASFPEFVKHLSVEQKDGSKAPLIISDTQLRVLVEMERNPAARVISLKGRSHSGYIVRGGKVVKIEGRKTKS